MSELPINFVDLIVLAVLLISAALAFFRGFVHEVLAIGAWLGAGLVTLYGFPHLQPYARDIIAIDLLADIVAGVVLFLIALVVLAILTRLVAAKVQNSSLGALDRSLGLLFGLARGGVILAALWLVLAWALPQPEERPDYIQNAKSRRIVEAGANVLAGLLPESLRADGAAAVDTVKSEAERAKKMKDAYDTLSRPAPKADAPETQKGYNDETRQGLDRLIESQTSESGRESE
jgi:membrane protein required for colicin V production